jgi:predicted DCC family thiol-disulfide oxidoreductase YuxK
VLSREELEAAAWALAPDGSLSRGAGAIGAVLDALLPDGWQPAQFAYRLPGSNQIADRVYEWVARNRHRLPGAAELPDGATAAPLTEVAHREIRRRRVAWADKP